MNLENQMMMTDALSATLNGSDPDGDIDKMYIPAVFAEHFVKIVVRECMDIAIQNGDTITAQSIGNRFGIT